MKVELKRILCPIDFSRNAAHATRYALALAEFHGAELFLLLVKEPTAPCVETDCVGMEGMVPWFVPEAPEEEREENLEEERTAENDPLTHLARGLQRSHKNVRISPLRVIGTPFLEIVRTAREQDVDLIVMGTHGRTGLAHMLIGSTAERVVRLAPCPVLTVKHPQHEFVMP